MLPFLALWLALWIVVTMSWFIVFGRLVPLVFFLLSFAVTIVSVLVAKP